MVPAFEREIRIRELIQLFVRERDPETLKILAAELQQLLKLKARCLRFGESSYGLAWPRRQWITKTAIRADFIRADGLNEGPRVGWGDYLGKA